VVDLDGNPLTANPTVQNEYNNSPARPNVAGTIAMAKLGGDPNSASNQYFFNLEDNSTTLGSQNNGGYTVFGGVIGDGMTLINTYAQQLPIVNLNPDTNDDGKPDSGPFDTTPIVFGTNYFLPLILNRAKVVDYLGNGLSTDVPAGGLTFANKDAFIDTGATFTGAGGLTIGVNRTLGIREGYTLNRALNNHGTLAPGLELGAITVQSSYLQFSDGTLNIEIAGTAPDSQYDQLKVTGTGNAAFLAGKLQLSFIAGFTPSLGNSFTVLTAPSIVLNFSSFNLPQLTIPGAVWHENLSSTSIAMSLDYADYNHDGVVDAADYIVWRKMLNQTVTSHTGADGDGDGHITAADFIYLKNHYGDTSGGAHGSGAGSLVNLGVPEPASASMALFAGLLFLARPGRRSASRLRA
ncbi:MAG TPA: peptidylprolyl isomerase, partial [Lacipirellulaceae bacterium]|nr:peptidylprolyl isomerase [Lacipirellulaceae bacterium]